MQTSPRHSSLLRCLVVATVSALLTPAGCRTEQVVEPDVGTLLKGAAPGAFLTGAPAGFGTPTIVNRRDFIYAVGFSRTHNQLAFAHHVSKSMELTSTLIEPLKPRSSCSLVL